MQSQSMHITSVLGPQFFQSIKIRDILALREVCTGRDGGIRTNLAAAMPGHGMGSCILTPGLVLGFLVLMGFSRMPMIIWPQQHMGALSASDLPGSGRPLPSDRQPKAPFFLSGPGTSDSHGSRGAYGLLTPILRRHLIFLKVFIFFSVKRMSHVCISMLL